MYKRQDYAILYNFTKEDNNVNNSDGSSPTAGLISSGNTLYGTASAGGVYGQGTVFAINTDGTGFTNLFNFGTENSGNNPVAGVALSGATPVSYTHLDVYKRQRQSR